MITDMRRAYTIDINEVGQWYTITEDGMVWTKIKGRWLKPRMNVYGYVFYSISRGTGMDVPLGAFAHTLVALKYIGKPPTDKHEVDHIDGNKANNHWTNLRWVTKSENILHSYALGNRSSNWVFRKGIPVSLETKMKMADAKKKRVEFSFGGGTTIYESIKDAATGLGTYRKKIYTSIKDHLLINGGYLAFIADKFES